MKRYVYIGIVVICVVGLFYVLNILNQSHYSVRTIDVRSYPPVASQTSTTPTGSEASVVQGGAPSLSCEEELQSNMKANKTQYQPGSILVAFNPSVTFTEALRIKVMHGPETLVSRISFRTHIGLP